MSRLTWTVALAWLALALLIAALRAFQVVRAGRAREALRRLRSPTVYLFAAYLLVAAFVTPLSSGESTSPLLWLALTLPLAHAATAFAAATPPPPRLATRLALALLFGGTIPAAAAIILALVSPTFVPAWLR